MSKEIIAKKAAIVEEVFEKFSNASSVVVVDYRGLTVDEVTELRKELREAGVEMRVIKNTFLRRAADKAGYEGLDETFTGPTAVAFGSEDATAPARIFSKFAEDHEALTIKGGMIDGKLLPSTKSTLLPSCQTAKACFPCFAPCFKHLFATSHTLSRQSQTAKTKVLLNQRLVA